MLYELRCILDAPKSAEPDLKKLQHHAEYLLDLDNWPEIKSVSDLTVKEYKTPGLSINRCMQLLNAVVNHAETANNTKAQIQELLKIGFTENELIDTFSFDEGDVKEAAEEIE